MQDKHHYHMISAELMFRTSDMPEGNVATIRLNGILKTESTRLRHKEIGLAQQIVQMALAKKINDETLQIVDVFMFPFTYLGHMTDSYFATPPEGEQAEVELPAVLQ
jgi:hypothetical protein